MNAIKKYLINTMLHWIKSEAQKSNDLEQKVISLFASPAKKIMDLLTAPTDEYASAALEILVKEEAVKFMMLAQQIAQEYQAQSTISDLLNLSSATKNEN